MNSENEPDNVVRLPLWRECAKEMIEQGLDHGKTYPSDYFEKWLKCTPDKMAFSLGIAEIRRALEHKGVYLSGRGQKGEQYVLLPAAAHRDVMAGYARKAMDALKRGVILGTNTRLDALDAENKRRHLAMLEKLATKTALVANSQRIRKMAPVAQLLEKSA